MNRISILLLTVILLSGNRNTTAQQVTSGTAKLPSPIDAVGLFDGKRAMGELVKQVEFGLRVPDSPGLISTRQLIVETLTANGWDVGKQDFTAKSPLLGQSVTGQNIFGVYPKGASVKYVISAHYDTRPRADMDPDPSRRLNPIPGANDGASGVAVLLELARVWPQTHSPHGVALVFYDLEDHGIPNGESSFCLGSQYFARNLPSQVNDFQYGINLDMIGDADLRLPMEGYSLNKVPQFTYDLWRVGSRLYPEVWIKERGRSVYDDHMPFLGMGKKYLDVIDINYPAWHTMEDTPDKCSPQSLDSVGDTIMTFILH